MIKKRGRIVIVINGAKRAVWGEVAYQDRARGALGTFMTEIGVAVPVGTRVTILTPTGGQQEFENIGSWKFIDHRRLARSNSHTIQKV